MTDERQDVEGRRIEIALSFLKSAILSGERWTTDASNVLNDAHTELATLREQVERLRGELADVQVRYEEVGTADTARAERAEARVAELGAALREAIEDVEAWQSTFLDMTSQSDKDDVDRWRRALDTKGGE